MFGSSFSVNWFLFVAAPIVLVTLAAMLLRKLGPPETAERRFFLFVTWTGLGIPAAMLAENLLPPPFRIASIMAPAACGLLAVALLRPQDSRALGRRGKALIVSALVLLVGLAVWLTRASMVSGDTPLLLIALPVNAAILAGAWVLGHRLPVGLWLMVLVYLALFTGLSLEAVPFPFEPAGRLPAWLPWLSAGIYLTLPGLVVATLAMLISAGLRHLPRPAAPRRLLSYWSATWPLVLACLLLVGLAYAWAWMGIWDQTDDGVRGFLFLAEFDLAAVAAAVMIGLTSTGWRRWGGLAFAGLMTGLVFWAPSAYVTPTIRQITEARASRLRDALEQYHAATGTYPADLGALAPAGLGWLPQPIVTYGQGWCYQAGSDYYRLGALYRDFGTPLSARVYATAGQPPEGSWVCDQKLAELTSSLAARVPTEVPLPTSVASFQRIPVQPAVRAASLVVGDWSPDGEYLIFGVPDPSGGQALLGPDFVKATTGELCRESERKWATGWRSDGLYAQYAWLPDGRALYVAESGRLTAFTPCAPGGQDLTSRYPTTFTRAVAYNVQSGRVLLRDPGAYWMLDGASLEAQPISDVTPNPDGNWPDRYAWSPGGERLSIARRNGPEAKDGSTIYIVATASGMVERSLPLTNTTDSPDSPVVEWLSPEDLLVQGDKALRVMDLRSDPPGIRDLIREVFLLDLAYPNDFSSEDSVALPGEGGYYVGVRVNHPHNQAAYVYTSKTARVEVFHPESYLVLFVPGGQWLQLPKFESPPTYRDEYELVWLDRPGETRQLRVAGHVPRSQPELFPKYLPNSSQLIFGSSQGISLVQIPEGETVRFWSLAGGGGQLKLALSRPIRQSAGGRSAGRWAVLHPSGAG